MNTPAAPRLYAQVAALVEGKLWARVLIGMLLGMIAGALLSPAAELVPVRISKIAIGWIALPGDLFLRLIQMIMIPLVIASIIQGIAGENAQARLARMGVRVGVYFLITTVLSIVIGTAAALLVQPGRGEALAHQIAGQAPVARNTPVDLPSLISGLLPTNALQSMISGEMLSIVIFAVIVGVALSTMERKRAEPLLDWFSSIQEICMTVTRWAMSIAPYAVFGLIARSMTASGLSVILDLGLYVATVLGSLLMILILYGIAVALTSDLSPHQFFSACKDVLLLAFSVASSAAVMPLSMKTAEEKLHVPREVTSFVIPVGAILNMNGTAAYQGIATVFLAQSYGMELTLPTLGLIVVTTTAASIGTPSAPGAGIVILASVLASAGIPAEGISLIIGVDYLLGMCRASVNVAGDLTACVVFAKQAMVETPGAEPAQPAGTLERPA